MKLKCFNTLLLRIKYISLNQKLVISKFKRREDFVKAPYF